MASSTGPSRSRPHLPVWPWPKPWRSCDRAARAARLPRGAPTSCTSCSERGTVGIAGRRRAREQDRLVLTTWHNPQHHGQLSTGSSTSSRPEPSVLRPASMSIAAASCPLRSRSRCSWQSTPPSRRRLCAGITTTQAPRHEGTILSVGRFAPYKGLDVLSRALDCYWARGGTRQFAAIGQGRVPRSIRELTRPMAVARVDRERLRLRRSTP